METKLLSNHTPLPYIIWCSRLTDGPKDMSMSESLGLYTCYFIWGKEKKKKMCFCRCG